MRGVITLQDYQHNPWLVRLADRLLQGDASVFPFFSHNPFPDPASPPKRSFRVGEVACAV